MEHLPAKASSYELLMAMRTPLIMKEIFNDGEQYFGDSKTLWHLLKSWTIDLELSPLMIRYRNTVYTNVHRMQNFLFTFVKNEDK